MYNTKYMQKWSVLSLEDLWNVSSKFLNVVRSSSSSRCQMLKAKFW